MGRSDDFVEDRVVFPRSCAALMWFSSYGVLVDLPYRLFLAGGVALGLTLPLLAGPGGPLFQITPVEERAPSRGFDARHLTLDLKVDLNDREVEGIATWQLRSLSDPLTEVTLDQHALDIKKVTIAGMETPWWVVGDRVVVDIEAGVPWGQEIEVAIHYRARPGDGLNWRGPSPSSPRARLEVWSQGEGTSNHHWFPLVDHPGDRFTFDGYFTVPPDMKVMSNGQPLETTQVGGQSRWHWQMKDELVSYLVMVAISTYDTYTFDWKDKPVEVWVPPGTPRDVVQANFDEVPAMLDFFSDLTGVPYPYASYRQVVVQDFIYGGMENTTATVLNERALVPLSLQENRQAESLLAHELGHQWYGDLLTCRTWGDIWLNEGFATWMATRWERHHRGEWWYGVDLATSRREVLKADAGGAGSLAAHMLNRVAKDAGGNIERWHRVMVYDKGGWILNMLENELGPRVFQEGIQLYTRSHRDNLVESDQLRRAFEDVSGRDLEYFFSQWVFLSGHPDLSVSHHYDHIEHQLVVDVRQTQTPQGLRPLFDIPLTLMWPDSSAPGGVIRRTGRVDGASARWYFPLAEAPAWVAVDPDVALLAAIDHPQTVEAWLSQLAAFASPGAVLEAVYGIARTATGDQDVAPLLALVLDEARPSLLRREVVRTLGEMGGVGEAALVKVLASSRHGGVREEVAKHLANAVSTSARDGLLFAAQKDTNERVRAAALASLGVLHDERVLPLARAALSQESDMQVLRIAGISALVATDDPRWLDDILKVAAPGSPKAARNEAISGAAQLVSRLGDDTKGKSRRREVVTRLAPGLRDEFNHVRGQTARALGTVGDPSAIPYLEAARRVEVVPAIQEGIEASLKVIRSGQPPSPPSAAEARITALEEERDTLRKRLDDLERRVPSTPVKP